VKYRQSLLLVSAIALAFVFLDIQPSSIEFLGLKIGAVSPRRGFTVLLLVQAYFLAAFHLHSARDFIASQDRALLHFARTGVDIEQVESEEIGQQGQWKREHWVVKSARVGLHYGFDAFEYTLPAILGWMAAAFVLFTRVV
jgi:hypothetical protein